jgi:serine/threonine protein kinase
LNVIKLYSTGEDHGYFYIAMELVGGGSLEQRIKNQGRLPEEDVLRIGLEVAEGLRAAQKDGLLHRDVKPANILFTDTGTAKVVDFGLAIFVDAQDEADTEIWATPYYVSPEKVIENTEDFRSDIFSLGATLYHALTGKPPHKANTASLSELRKIKSEKVVLEDTGLTFSPRTAVVVNRMLAISPEKRHPNYAAVLEDLRVAQRMVGGRVRLLGSRRQRFLAVSAAAVVLAMPISPAMNNWAPADLARSTADWPSARAAAT